MVTVASNNIFLSNNPTTNLFNNTASNNYAGFRNDVANGDDNIEATFTLPSPIYGVTKIETMTWYANQASLNGGALFTLAQTGSSAFNTLYNSATPINLLRIFFANLS